MARIHFQFSRKNVEDAEESALENTFEFKFARDLIRYVAEERMQGLNWIPRGIFDIRRLEERIDSPFTPQMKTAVNGKLDRYEVDYHMEFNKLITEENLEIDNYNNTCSTLAHYLVNDEFSVKKFFTFCVIISKFAAYAYLYGATSATEDAAMLIIGTVRQLKIKSLIDDNFWNALQDFAEDPDLIDQELPFRETLSLSDSTDTTDELDDLGNRIHDAHNR